MGTTTIGQKAAAPTTKGLLPTPPLPETARPVDLTENARQVLERRYLAKDKNGKPIETPEQLFRRVARTIASAELIYDSKADTGKWEEEFYYQMANLDFLPNSPTLMNAGRELGQLSA